MFRGIKPLLNGQLIFGGENITIGLDFLNENELNKLLYKNK